MKNAIFIYFMFSLILLFIVELFFVLRQPVWPMQRYNEGFDGNAKVHLVLYSNNEPFNTAKQLTIDSVKDKADIVVHSYSFDDIQKKEWFSKIKDLTKYDKKGKRDGYYNAWKPFIVKDVYNEMGDNDVLYYVDSSQYFVEGFTEPIDKIVEIANKKGIIAGSIGNDLMNFEHDVCNNTAVWDEIMTSENVGGLMYKQHVLNSWFLMKKNELNTKVLDEWMHYVTYTSEKLPDPLVTYHHTGDQSIFNILVNKYHLTLYCDPKVPHGDNKNKNLVLKTLNSDPDYEKYFINL